jgi:hypothetical protein
VPYVSINIFATCQEQQDWIATYLVSWSVLHLQNMKAHFIHLKYTQTMKQLSDMHGQLIGIIQNMLVLKQGANIITSSVANVRLPALLPKKQNKKEQIQLSNPKYFW